jgi:transcription initiation factor TFIIIB Brf1 subunit/transcription initiation factor TFIIB
MYYHEHNCPDCGQTFECADLDDAELVSVPCGCVQARDPAWESEQHLRNMEGYGDYEGPVT